jgi:predicted N-acetyltransferase YhbS
MKNDTSIFSNDKHLAHASEATRQGYNVKVLIRRLHEDEKEKALRFLKSVFEGWRSSRQWGWKFREVEEAQHRKAIIWVMEDQGKIIGHLAAIPMELRVGSEVFPVCQLVDGALSPEYRHKGLYKNLFQGVLEDAVKSGYVITFGFPNRFFYRLCERQGGFQNMCQISKMFKVLSIKNALSTLQISLFTGNSVDSSSDSMFRDFLLTQRWKALSILLDLFRKAVASTVSSWLGSKQKTDKILESKPIQAKALGTEFDSSWGRFSQEYRVSFERDRKYLNWRYSNPEAHYQAYIVTRGEHVAGYVVIACEEGGISLGKLRVGGLKIGYIVDLVAEKDLKLQLLSIVEEELKKSQVCLENCWTTEGSSFFRTLRAEQYYQLPDELYKVVFVANVHASHLRARINSSHLQATISSAQAKDILVTLGDSDLV